MDTTATAQIQAMPGASTRDLANTIEMMDGLSQDGFNQIMSIAKLALLSLETPAGNRNLVPLAHALELMAAHAQDTMNCINTHAESVGHPWRDEAHERRSRAAREASLHS
ncbi:hypothetical protein CTI10_015695 [Delftia acidovorans]|uniref:Uncharacterized protein n=1 Tax=Chryseobacterium sp. B5 TaxID=2050562 RepID=A0A2G7T896_9FLAO|nr:hypothetical protein CTI10_015695 [Delftia acidovorans]